LASFAECKEDRKFRKNHEREVCFIRGSGVRTTRECEEEEQPVRYVQGNLRTSVLQKKRWIREKPGKGGEVFPEISRGTIQVSGSSEMDTHRSMRVI